MPDTSAASAAGRDDDHRRDENCRNGGDKARPDGQGGQMNRHELSLLTTALRNVGTLKRAPTRVVRHPERGAQPGRCKRGVKPEGPDRDGRSRRRRSSPATSARSTRITSDNGADRQPARSATARPRGSTARRPRRRRTLAVAITMPDRRRLPRRGVWPLTAHRGPTPDASPTTATSAPRRDPATTNDVKAAGAVGQTSLRGTTAEGRPDRLCQSSRAGSCAARSPVRSRPT